jgi:hypothetical protein
VVVGPVEAAEPHQHIAAVEGGSCQAGSREGDSSNAREGNSMVQSKREPRSIGFAVGFCFGHLPHLPCTNFIAMSPSTLPCTGRTELCKDFVGFFHFHIVSLCLIIYQYFSMK